MMKAMRDRVKLIYWVVIVTFVGLTFLVWGVGLDGDTGPQQGTPGAIASVNGVDISYDAWIERVNGILNQMRTQLGEGESLSENQVLRAREEAYENLIMETLERSEAQRMGLSVTDEEIVDILSNNPPPYLLAQFADAEGNIDYDAYARALKNPNLPWQQIEGYIRQTVPLEKLEQRIAGRAIVGDAEIREAFAEQNVKAVAEYVGLDFSTLDADTTAIPPAEIQAWYDTHLDEYELPERSTVRSVMVPKAASEADREAEFGLLLEIRNDVLTGDLSFAEAAQIYSEDTTNSAQGGDLGFFDRNRMVDAFTEIAFAMDVGDISEPAETQFGIHLIHITDEKTDDDGERVEIQASHILLKLRPSQTTIDELRASSDGLRKSAEAEGLEAAATTAELAFNVSAPFQDGFNIPGVPNSLPGARWAFEHESGSLSPVFETQDNFYLFEVVEQLPAGHRPLDEVSALVESRIRQEQRAEAASAKLAIAWVKILEGSSLEDAAAEFELTHAVTDTFSLRENIPGIGFASAFARAALDLEVGESANDVQTQRGAYILKTLYKSELDEEALRAQRAGIARSLLFNRRRQILAEWQRQLREDADVEDFRDQFL